MQEPRSYFRHPGTPLVPKPYMDFGTAENLSGFAVQYRFFSPALLYLFGFFTDHHLVDFLREQKHEVPIWMYTFDRPIFAGMEDRGNHSGWNHTLLAVTTDQWTALESFILSVAICDYSNKAVFRTGAQDINIADPLWVDRNSGLLCPSTPLLPIVVFGVNGSAGCVALNRHAHPPAACRFKPLAETVGFGRYVLQDEPRLAHSVLDTYLSRLPAAAVKPDFRDINSLDALHQQSIRDAIALYKKEFGQ